MVMKAMERKPPISFFPKVTCLVFAFELRLLINNSTFNSIEFWCFDANPGPKECKRHNPIDVPSADGRISIRLCLQLAGPKSCPRKPAAFSACPQFLSDGEPLA